MEDFEKDMHKIKLAMITILLLGSVIAISIFIFTGGIERNIEIFYYEVIILISILFIWFFCLIDYIIKYKYRIKSKEINMENKNEN